MYEKGFSLNPHYSWCLATEYQLKHFDICARILMMPWGKKKVLLHLPWRILSSNDCSEENQVCERGDWAFIFHPFVLLAVVFSWGHVWRQMPTLKLCSRGRGTAAPWKVTGKVNHLCWHTQKLFTSGIICDAGVRRSPDPEAQSVLLCSECRLHGVMVARNTWCLATAVLLFSASKIDWNTKSCLILPYSLT